jgi:transcriptional regulator of acetoin/glycerol metabolism
MHQHTVVDDRQIGVIVRDDAPNSLAQILEDLTPSRACLLHDGFDSERWPGNVRELRNAVERAAILCEGGLIASQHLTLQADR